MGQPIAVTARPGIRPEVMHFEINRSLTGMETERYASAEAATGHRPPDELARRLFALGVSGITIYSSVITVVAPAEQWATLKDKALETIENLFIYYRDGAAPPAAITESSAPAPS